MKNIVLTLVLIFSLSAFSQTAPTPAPDKVVKKALYTKAEREKARKNFFKEVDKIGMSPEVKKNYLAIVDKHVQRLNALNKDRKMTQSQAKFNTQKIINEQNQEIQKILTVDQYNKHMTIINRYENSIVYRIEKQ